MRRRLCAVFALVFSLGCEKDPVTNPQDAPAAPTTPPPSADDAEADDAVRVLRVYYPIGRAVGDEDWRSAGCFDRTVGYEELAACIESVASKIRGYAATMPDGPLARYACGHEIETVHRAYVTAQAAFRSASYDWLKANRARLEPRMRTKPLHGACSGQKFCESRPLIGADPWSFETGWDSSRIKCTTVLFECLPGHGNVCWVNKVADRLGLGKDRHPGPLLVKSTGRRLN